MDGFQSGIDRYPLGVPPETLQQGILVYGGCIAIISGMLMWISGQYLLFIVVGFILQGLGMVGSGVWQWYNSEGT